MGFNTVAFLLNDYVHTLEASPKTVAWMLAHAPMLGSAREEAWLVADKHVEPRVHPQVLEVLPSWHADGRKFFVAGGNCITECPALRWGKDKETGQRTVTLLLPSWWRA